MLVSEPRRLAVCAALILSAVANAQRPDYPPTRVEDVVDKLHGTSVPDPYRWLEKSDDPAVQSWTEAQNALTRALLDRYPQEREKIAHRLEQLNNPPAVTPPRIHKDRYFFTRREGKQNHAVVYEREGNMDAEPRSVLDPNTFSADGTVALDWWFPSPDGTLIAYGKSDSGSERSTLYLRDVTAAADAALLIPHTRACTVAWEEDGTGFYYVRYPQPGSVAAGDENYYRHIYYHKFGTEPKNDAKIYGEGRPKEEWHDVSSSSDYRYLFLSASLDWAKNDLFFRPMKEKEFRTIADGLDGQFNADVVGDKLVIHTNYQAPRYHIVVTDVDQPGQENWKEVVPQQAGVIKDFSIIDSKIVCRVLEDAYSKLVVYQLDGKKVLEFTPPEPATINGLSGRHDKSELYFTYQTFTSPPSVLSMSWSPLRVKAVHELNAEKELSIKPNDYVTRQVWFKSRDGTPVPMFVIHKKSLKLDGSNPTVLYGYGGFDVTIDPTFSAGLFPWLERGGVYAIANLRGGGEFGKEWHLAGRLEKKQNVFDDMIAAAEKLIADGYTKPERLGVRGGSNGGLLMGALLTQRPDLFKAVHCAVPLLDMVRYHNFSIARLWIPEYGSAENADQFKTLLAYSPYHHVKKGEKYPAVLFTTADSDSRVDPMHARKMAAAVQAANASDNPILLWVETKAGHGAGKPLSKVIESQVDYWIFFEWQLGMLDG